MEDTLLPAESEAVFFIDWGLGRRDVTDTLRAKGVRIELHGDHFPQEMADSDWLTEVGRRGWFVLTKDGAIRQKPKEREAARTASVGLFIFNNANLAGSAMALAFGKALSEMLRLARGQPRPFVAIVNRADEVKLA